MIEGLTMLEQSERGAVISGGAFANPPSCDTTKFSYRWAEEGPQVEEAEQPEFLAFAGVKAKGWAIHKITEKGKKTEDGKNAAPLLIPYKRVVGKKKYVLMQRPLELQRAINKIYANQSRARVNDEVNGEVPADPGVLTNADLRKIDGGRQSEDAGGYLQGIAGVDPEFATEIKLA